MNVGNGTAEAIALPFWWRQMDVDLEPDYDILMDVLVADEQEQSDIIMIMWNLSYVVGRKNCRDRNLTYEIAEPFLIGDVNNGWTKNPPHSKTSATDGHRTLPSQRPVVSIQINIWLWS